MTDRVVVDASVMLKLAFNEPLTSAAEAITLRYLLQAPDIIVAETANGLWKSVRLGSLTPGDAQMALGEMSRIVEHVASDVLAPRALEIALQFSHPVDDCLYAALAERERIPFVTADKKLLGKLAAGLSQLELVDLSNLPDPLL